MNKSKRYKALVLIAFVPILIGLAFFFLSGDNMEILRTVFSEDLTTEQMRDHLQEFGIRGYITISILSMLQVVMTVIPSEPIEVLSGLTFGFWRGALACLFGVFLGNTLIYVLYKIFGERLRDYFDKQLDVDISKVGKSAKLIAVILFLYFLPAVTYGLIAFFAATMGMKYPRYITVTVLGAIPSVCIGVGLGHIALSTGWEFSVIILAVVVVLLVLIMKNRDFLVGKLNAYISKKNEPYSSKTVVGPYSSFIASVAYVVSMICLAGKVKVKIKNNVGKLDRPAIVLINHGAFIDFVYAGTALHKERPNFIVNRMYFYRKDFGKLVRKVGCFPKSMFVNDVESAMNCVRVIKRGGVLAMMPEARLSTVGKFEDVQGGTYAFLKKMGAHVYVIKIRGDYLAKPKWGKGLRRGSFVDCTLDRLFTPDQLAELTEEQIRTAAEDALRYNEFEWLASHPEIKYRSRKMAEGLENILTKCPACHARYSISTKGKRLWCDSCGLSLEVDNRYRFVGSVEHETFADWYEWQIEEYEREILADPDFALRSPVILKNSSIGGKGFLREVGRGECVLNREGLTYIGTKDGENIEKHFPMSSIYRLLFGAGENFELYEGKEIYYFIPDELRSAVDWYIVSGLLKKITQGDSL